MSKADTFSGISDKVAVSSNLVRDRIVGIYNNSAIGSNDFTFICQCMILYIKGKWNSKYTVDMDGKKVSEEDLKATLNALKIFKDMNEKSFASLLAKMGTAFVHLFQNNVDLNGKLFAVYSKHNLIFKEVVAAKLIDNLVVPDWFIGDFSKLKEDDFSTMAKWFKGIKDLGKDFSTNYSNYLAGLTLKALRNYSTKSATKKEKIVISPPVILKADQGFRKQVFQVMLTYKLGGMPGTAKPFSDVGLFDCEFSKEILVKVMVVKEKCTAENKTFSNAKERYDFVRMAADGMTV